MFFNKKNATADALRQSLVELSKSGNTNFKECNDQIREARAALLSVEGYDASSFKELEQYLKDAEAKKAEVQALSEEIGRLKITREKILSEISDLKLDVAELSHQVVALAELSGSQK